MSASFDSRVSVDIVTLQWFDRSRWADLSPPYTHTDFSAANMLAITFSVGNSNVDVMCMFSTGQQFATLLVIYLASQKSVGRRLANG